MISSESIEKVKAAADIKSVVEGSGVKLKRVGSALKGLCPFHTEKTPSFTVTPAKNIFKCFGCGKSGDPIAFVMELQKLSFLEAVVELAKQFNIETEEHQKKEFIKPVARLEKVSPKVIEYFESRKISNNTLLRFGITEAIEWMPDIEKETKVICFNYYRDETLVNIKFRSAAKGFKMAKDAELIFYNLNAIKGQKECVIVEGEIDSMTMHECGIYNSVSVPNGASIHKQRLDYLDNCWSYFADMEKIILVTDNDNPGNKLREELARRLGKERCYQVTFPEGCKDANDVLVKLGKDCVLELIKSATEWPLHGLVTMDEMFPKVEDYYENGYPEGDKAMIHEFDQLLSFYPGQLTIWTGIPGSGKSEFVDYIMASLSKFHKWVWGICSFESPPDFHVTKLAEKFTGKSFAPRTNPSHRMTVKELEYAISVIESHFHFINISQVDITMDGLIAKATELVLRKGINGLLFDPWNCIEHKYGDENETKYILSCLNKLVVFADRYKVHVFLVAHPTKVQKDKKTGLYEIPTMYSISGSAHFFNRTHNGVCVWRNFQTNVVEVFVQKVKWSWLGSLGSCTFTYNTFTRQYETYLGTGDILGDTKPKGWQSINTTHTRKSIDDKISDASLDQELPF